MRLSTGSRAAERLEQRGAHGRIRVLHVIQNLNYGGMERLLADIVLGVDPARFESHVLCLKYFGRFAEGLGRAATLHLAPRLPPHTMVWPARLVRLLRSIDPDVVHTHSGVLFKVALAARIAGVPAIVHTEHGRTPPDPLLDRIVDRIGASLTSAVVAVSEPLRDTLVRSHIMPASRIRVIENGVDTSRFRPQTDTGKLRAELGIGSEVPIIGSIGRLEAVKAYDVMLEAYARLLARWSGSVRPLLVLAGEGSERARLETIIRARALGEGVRLLGWRDDVHDLLSAFALFTMSSRSEGTSVSLLEAMSSGLCPVVTDVGGNAAVLGRSLAHRLVPARDAEALATNWLGALTGGERKSVDGRAARERVEQAFSLTRMVQRYQDLYGTLARRAPVRTGGPADEACPL